MSRIVDPTSVTAAPPELVAAIRARRGGELLNLDRMLLLSPPYAQGWNALLGEVRTRLELAPKLRELAICAVAVLNGADYEFAQHAPEFLAAGGTRAQLEALRAANDTDGQSKDFCAAERAVLDLTREMTRQVRVTDEVFERARAVLSDARQMVELVAVIATYNMVSRFLVALAVEPE
jgi:alkylhydroperoxidase family enzyme